MLLANVAAGAAEPVRYVAEVDFNDSFLNQPDGGRIDVSRFKKGNVAAPGTYRAELYVNEAWIGKADVTLRAMVKDKADVRPCMDSALLERMGADLSKLSPEALARLEQSGEACVTLSELIDGGWAEFDNGELRLNVNLPQLAMTRQARGYVDPKYWENGVPAARVQYNGNLYRWDSGSSSSTQSYLGINATANIGPWRFRHNGSFTHSDFTGSRYQSIQTTVTRSIAQIRSQLVLGDAYTDGSIFDSVGFRGFQLASDERMYPESQRGYAPVVRGVANSNARVQIRQNGNLIFETSVPAGPFEINDLYPTGYGGDLEVVVTEADGSTLVSRVPYAAAVNALRAGSTRYTVTGGVYRNTSVHSTPAMFQATFKHGFTNTLTGYGGLTGAENYYSGQVGVGLNTDYGAFGLDVTHATARFKTLSERNGQSVRVSYSKLLEPTNTNLTLAAYRYSTSGYLGLSDAMLLRDLDERGLAFAMPGILRGRLQLQVNQVLPQGYGNFYLTGSTQDYWNRNGRDTQFQAGYNNTYKRLNYGVSVGRQFNVNTAKWDNRVMLTLGIPLGNSARPPYSTTTLQHSSQGGTVLQEGIAGALGDDGAFTYGVNASHQSGAGSTSSVGANASYVSPYASLSGSATRGNNFSQLSAGISGGIVAYPGGVVLGPNVNDTIAVVEAKDAAGARIMNAAGLRVDPLGRAVVPNLIPFSRNRIEVDPTGLPLNVELKSTMQQTAPTAGAVVRMKFETDNPGQVGVIQAKLPNGKPVPFAAEAFDESGAPVGVVAQAGRIFARGLKARSGALTVKWGDKPSEMCKATYQFPAEGDAGSELLSTTGECVQ
ncbi:fimbria/pilus outer membrane usher protein [Cupriavidus sp. NPDC089707]|uniref:fimbria/pilus outer membrane usher protein n=1 Tax=Cupriavidus sp. NPDC089707 TaxID=3363963 RepID=UPI003814852F